jgi:hypothetical protein
MVGAGAAVGVTRPGGPPAADEASEEETGVGCGRTPEAAGVGAVGKLAGGAANISCGSGGAGDLGN